jgi:hypothetical protein
MNNLKQKWGNFLTIALGPGSVIFIILTISSLIAAFYFQENKNMSALLSILGSIFGSISGSFVRDDYNRISGESILEKKGLSAIRNLKSIEMQLGNIQLWVRGFAKEKITKGHKCVLNEIDRHISTTQLNIQSGFSDWVDMVPELAQEAGYIAEITKKQQEVFRAYVGELLDKKKELVSSSDKKRVDELKKRISVLEKQIKDIRSDSSRSIGVSVPFSSISITGNTPFAIGSSGLRVSDSIVSMGFSPKCINCGKSLEQQSFGALGGGGIYDSYCADCKNKLFNL